MTGWRIGYTAVSKNDPLPLIKAMAKIQGQSTSNPTNTAQTATLAALTGSQDCVAQMRKAFDEGVSTGELNRFFAEVIGQQAGQLWGQDPRLLTYVTREPVGVAALLGPWNAPLALTSMKIAGAMAFGNSCVAKPSEVTPLAVARLMVLLQKAGVPDGVVNLVNGRGTVTGAALVAHPQVDLVSFTGGTATGRAIHGPPNPPDADEPRKLSETIRDMQLRYVVVTSVDRDDLMDGGAQHYVDCIRETRALSPNITIEILTPDFRGKGRMERALEVMRDWPPDVFNHNLETVRELYPNVRPGADYDWSLRLRQQFKAMHPGVPTKSGIMLGLGEDREQVIGVLRDLRAHDVDMITMANTCSRRPIIIRCCAIGRPRSLPSSSRLGWRWASPTLLQVCWCGLPIMLIAWRRMPASSTCKQGVVVCLATLRALAMR